jgi:hypothetical protein
MQWQNDRMFFPSYRHPNGNFRWDVLLWQVQSELWHSGLAKHQKPWDRNSSINKCYHCEAETVKNTSCKQEAIFTRNNKVVVLIRALLTRTGAQMETASVPSWMNICLEKPSVLNSSIHTGQVPLEGGSRSLQHQKSETQFLLQCQPRIGRRWL